MQFYLRDKELNQLANFIDSPAAGSKFILLTGARKVGKTALVNKLLAIKKGIYLTITRNATSIQLKDISEYLREYNPPGTFIPKFENWKHLFEYFFTLAKDGSFTIVVDEFQNLESVNVEAYTEFMSVWNRFATTSMLNFVAVSFSQRFINEMFHGEDSLFYKLPNYTLKLVPFSFIDVISLFKANKSNLSLDEIVDVYLVFGGYPKYYNLMDIFNLWDSKPEEILQTLVFQPYAPLGNELKDIIINLFTRESKTYISILQTIAHNKHSLTEIAENISIPTTTIGKYLSALENKKHIIKRKLPLSAKSVDNSKFGRYFIRSYFENFWFRFVQPDIISYEMGQYDKIMRIIKEEFPGYRKNRMPILIRELIHHSHDLLKLKEIFPYDISVIGSIWDRKHFLDVIAFNDENKEALIGKICEYAEELSDKEADQLSADLNYFDSQFVGYKIHKVIFQKSERRFKRVESKNNGIEFFSYGNLLQEVYEK